MEITHDERRWVWKAALWILLLTSIPYFLGYVRQGEAWRFTGFVFGVEDGNSYIAKMLNGAAGEWLFRTPYTAEPQNGFFAFAPYFLLGKLTAPPGQHEQLVVLFQMFRWVGGLLYLLATYDFLALFLREVRWRRLGTLLAALGGGLGWLVLLGVKAGGFNGLPLEWYSPESFGFLAVFGLPHLAAGRAFLLWGLRAYLLPVVGDTAWRPALWGGVCWALLGLMQPLTVLVAWTVLGAAFAAQTVLLRLPVWRAELRRAAVMVLLSLPLVLYTFLSFQLDSFLKGWQQQNLILSPPPLDYLLAYGVMLPFAVLGARRAIGEKDMRAVALVSWLVIFPLLAYFPYPLQRRLPEGIWTAWIGLALYGLSRLPVKKAQRWALAFLPGFLPALLLLLGGGMAAWTPRLPVFRPAAETAAWQYIAADKRPDCVALTAFESGNALPAWAHCRVVIGHGPESVHLSTLRPQVQRFYQTDTADADRRALLRQYHVRYVVWGPTEQALGDWNPASLPDLQPVFQSNGFVLFEVKSGL